MPKRTSHSSQITRILLADGQLSFGGPQPSQAASVRHRGPEIGDDLLTWASTNKSAAAERINSILELIVELGEHSRQNDKAEEQLFELHGRTFAANVAVIGGSLPKRSAREVALETKLNHRLLAYRLSPWYYASLGLYPILGWWSKKDRPKDDDDPAANVWFTEEDAIIQIIDLAREGLLSRIRRCPCRGWFFAKFSHQRFCCTRCQQAYFRSSPEYREKRKKYMKDLRALHKKTYFPSHKKHSSSPRHIETTPRRVQEIRGIQKKKG